jgi:hypothetical protein
MFKKLTMKLSSLAVFTNFIYFNFVIIQLRKIFICYLSFRWSIIKIKDIVFDASLTMQ